MKRRLNIAVGLLHNPKIVYMDEPTVGIDPQSRRRILDAVIELKKNFGMTVLYTTHYMEEAQELSDRVAIIDHGEIIALGTIGELIQMVGEQDNLQLRVGEQPVPEGVFESFRNVEGVTNVVRQDGDILVTARRGRKALPHLIQIANEAGLDIASVAVQEPDLEAVFLHLTGRALRE
jgi:ABC-2 type transport system ATP-binding protein